MSKVLFLIGCGLLFLLGLFDYWVWSSLIGSNLSQIGSVVGFGILALISIPATFFGFIIALKIMVADE
jgi:hypothetical protein